MKSYVLAFSLAAFPAAIYAQQADPCAGLVGSALGQCRGDQQKLQQQQLENMRLQNELLRNQLEHDKSATQAVQASATDYSKTPEIKSWKSDNPWYGMDYAKTQFAMRYAKQLQRERPDLAGRPFLDAVSDKVRDTFGPGK